MNAVTPTPTAAAEMPTAAPTAGPRSSAPARVTGLPSLTMRLTRARFADRSGETLLYGASVLAATVCSAITFTLAGGTWMFYSRSTHPTGLLAELSADPTFRMILSFYIGLAALACALVLPALLSLIASGAQLGARGRERRLASLRLVGLSAGDVTRMALMDAALQIAAGTLLGFGIYLASLPAWGQMTFEAVRVQPSEMLLPWPLSLATMALLLLLGLSASAWGLLQVRISPLGVARRANRPAVRVWRLVAFTVVLAGAVALLPASMGSARGLYVSAAVLLVLLLGIDLAGPWLLQQSARVVAQAPWPAVVTAARRVMAQPSATWRRTSTLGVLAFVACYLASVPFSYDPNAATSMAERTFMTSAQADFLHGAAITLTIGFVLTATSLLISQASATIERAEQSRALHRLGAPASFGLRVAWLETFAPLLLSVALGSALGSWAAAPMAAMIRKAGLDQGHSTAPVIAVLVGGVVIAALALLASHPLYHRLLQDRTPTRD